MKYFEKNLFSSLFKWASSQSENFCTEAFVWVIRQLLEKDKEIAERLLSRLCFNTEDTACLGNEDIEVWTQVVTKEFGIPDMMVQTKTSLCVVEVKVDAKVSKKQLKDYENYLKGQKENPSIDSPLGRDREGRLILLSRDEFNDESCSVDLVNRVRWYEVADWLRDEEPKDYFLERIVREFVGFLDRQKISVWEEERSAISKELTTYLRGTREKSIFNERLRGKFRRIESEVGLGKTCEHLKLIGEVLKKIDKWKPFRFDSDQKGWITYNLNNSLYFVSLTIQQPEWITVDRFKEDTRTKEGRGNDGVDVKRHNPNNIGEVKTWHGIHSWINKKDLTPDFFEEPREERFRLLERFFRESINHADKTWGRGR